MVILFKFIVKYAYFKFFLQLMENDGVKLSRKMECGEFLENLMYIGHIS